MANFSVTYNGTLKHEGGFSLRSADPGGYTYMGLTKKDHPSFKGWPLVAKWVAKYGGPARAQNKIFPDPALDKMVMDYVKKNFWDKYLCDKINNQHIAGHVYDFCFNSGKGAAIINEALGLPAVNKITMQTVAAINNGDPEEINQAIYEARYNYVTSLTIKHPKTNKLVKLVSLNRGLLVRMEKFKNLDTEVRVFKNSGGYTGRFGFLNYLRF